ncbi:FHA domain-containing protein [Sulfuriroseicoccus oceanibius]|uniref:FHA domain-containing protein n=1 Tax=Sulfuriroseicoccus oceanibius TaxID=2707525 RepID=A0A6B3LEG9_9BACT|nr:FHA domain-containing protein [Sulfuriroseicoccus oceanibius]QQL44754.1 FHA domain-containing protein [Sulfuriroseicoccus oceanibius]
MSAHISLTLPNGEVKRFSLEIDLVRIGRAPDNTIALDDASLSSHHCVITRKGDDFKIEDLDSTNGVELNGKEIDAHTLAHGDVVKMGEIMLTFEADGEAPLDPAPPAEHEDFLITEPAAEESEDTSPETRRVAQAVPVDEDDDEPAPRRKVTQAIPVDEEDDEEPVSDAMAAAPATTAPPARAARPAQPAYVPQKSGGGIGGFIVSLFVVVLSLLIGLSLAHYRATGGILPLDLLDQLQK